MPSETTRFERRWRRWGGTPADIALLARRAEDLLTAANAEDPQAKVTVKHQRGDSSYGSAEEAREHLGEVDLATVHTVHVMAGSPWKDIGIIVNFFKNGPYLSVEGGGSHRVAVAGIAEAMSTELDRYDRSYPHEWAIAGALLAGCLVMIAGTIGARAAGAPPAIPLALSVVAMVLILGFLWIMSIRVIAVPAFELHREKQQSRTQRWGGRLRRFSSWALTLVLGAVLGALVQRWLE